MKNRSLDLTPTHLGERFTPDQLEAMLKDADENGANYFVPINWRRLGPKFLALWRAAENVPGGSDTTDALREAVEALNG